MSAEITDIIISEADLRNRVAELAAKISEDYSGQELVLVGILKGGFIFLADLCRQITVPMIFDFMTVSSYGSGTKSCGVVRIQKDLEVDIAGKHVIIVEDIIDSGLTLNYLHKSLRVRNPASLEICTLLRKPEMDKVSLDAKYLGFSIPNDFVVGYGLDYAQQYRNLPYIARIKVLPKVNGNKTNKAAPSGAARR